MALHESFLTYRRFRYLKLSGLFLLACTAVYALPVPDGRRGGGTWPGYALGSLAAALVVWLLLFGVRKRSYRSRHGSLRGWLSAHTYLGCALLLVVPLHSGFQVGMNVHTLAYVLLVAVVASGLVGVLLYVVLPERISTNRAGEKPEGLVERIAELDADAVHAAEPLPDVFARAVASSIEQTQIGGGLLAQLRRAGPDTPTARAMQTLRGHEQELRGEQRDHAAKLLELLAVKQTLLRRVQRDVRMRAWLSLWLVAHVPLSVATLVAVMIHVLAVFYYIG